MANPNNTPAGRAQLATPEFNALGGPTYDEPARTIDEARALGLGPAPVGSKDYVAGQPADAEEAARTEALARAKAEAAGPDRTRRLREEEGEV